MKLREICTLGACVAVLAACVVEPSRHGDQGYYEGGRGGGHHGHQDSDYGHGGGHGYSRGDRYRGDGSEVGDWRGHGGLYEPPRCYHWVQNGNQFLLAAVATGIISAIVLAH